MAVDVSSFNYLLPIWAFLLVFVISFAMLTKLKLFGENPWWHVFISFFIASIFITAADARSFVSDTVPWAVVVLIAGFFVLLLTGFLGKGVEGIGKGVSIFLVVALFLVFFFGALHVFGGDLFRYLPGGSGSSNSNVAGFFDWLYSARVSGALLLLIVCALVSWVLVKTK